MGMVQSRKHGGKFYFEEDPSYQRDADDYLIENYGVAEYVGARGPPSRLHLYTNLFLKKDYECLRYHHRAVLVTDEMRRMFALLVHAGRKARDELLPHILQVLDFLDFATRQPCGPAPHYSSRAYLLIMAVTVDRVDRPDRDQRGVKVKSSWRLVPDASLPYPARHQHIMDVPIRGYRGRIHPDQLLLNARCWMDGWKRLHMEFEKLPVFLADTQPSTLWMMEDQTFGLVEAHKDTTRMWVKPT